MPVQNTEINLKKQEHPHLFLNREELARVRELIRQEGSYQHKRFAQIKGGAEAWLAKPLAIPSQGAEGALVYVCSVDSSALIYDPDKPHEHICPKCGRAYRGGTYDRVWRAFTHARIAVAARDLALTYALTHDELYARAAANILLAYADRYASFPVVNLSKVGREMWDDWRSGLSMAAAYDLIHDSGLLNRAQQLHIERDLLLETARLMQIAHGMMMADRVGGGISNFQAGVAAGVGALALFLRDRELADFAINGPVGFNRLAAEGVLDSGLWWEGSFGYHSGVAHVFLFLAEAAWHSGLNLYTNERFRRMMRAPLLAALPDNTLPATNDGLNLSTKVEDRFRRLAEVYYARSGDAAVEPLLIPGHITGFDTEGDPFDLALWLTPDWPESQPARPQSVNMAPNFAILRTDPDVEDIYLLLDYGPHGGTHGHPDRLSIILYANGRLQAPDFGHGCDYRLPEWREWYQQTLSHNTVVVDGQSQHTGARLNLFYTSPRAKIADASPVTDRWSDDVPFQVSGRMRRTVALLDESFLVDIFRVQQGQVYDWVYHNFGTFETDSERTEPEARLGDVNGYQHISNARRRKIAAESWSGSWLSEGQGLKLTLVGAGDMEIITGDGLGPQIDETMPLLIARSTRRDTIFKAVLEPFRGEPSIRRIEELAVERVSSFAPGSRQQGTEGVGLKVEKRDGAHHCFLLGYAWGVKRFGDITFNGQLAFLSYAQEACDEGALPSFLCATHTSRLERGGFRLRADKMISLYLERVAASEYVLAHQSGSEARIEITGEGLGGVKVRRLDDEGNPSEDVDARVVDGALSFEAAAKTQYGLSLAQ